MQNPLVEMPEASQPQPLEHGSGTARVLKVNRQQIEMRVAALDSLIGEDHKMRIIWAMVQGYDF